MPFLRRVILGVAALAVLGAQAGAAPRRDRLVGAWRLVAMDYAGPNGERVDPFYQPGSGGLIVYDRSGWMSVQITAPERPPFEVPAARAAGTADDGERHKAAAFDTYYAYYGRWDYDATTGVVTHHVVAALIPAEVGLSYRQTVTFESGRMVFTTRSGTAGAMTLRHKVWERLPAHTRVRSHTRLPSP